MVELTKVIMPLIGVVIGGCISAWASRKQLTEARWHYRMQQINGLLLSCTEGADLVVESGAEHISQINTIVNTVALRSGAYVSPEVREQMRRLLEQLEDETEQELHDYYGVLETESPESINKLKSDPAGFEKAMINRAVRARRIFQDFESFLTYELSVQVGAKGMPLPQPKAFTKQEIRRF